MRPDISEELIKRVIEKWRRENKLVVEIPKSKIIEDVLLRYLEYAFHKKVRDRKRDRLIRKFIKMRYMIRPGIYKKRVKIDSAKFGSIVVNNKEYTNDVMVSYKGLVQECKPTTRHVLSKRELNLILVEEPETIIVGCGHEGCMQLSPEVVELAGMKGVQIMPMKTVDATEKFNEFYDQGKKVVAYMHITC